MANLDHILADFINLIMYDASEFSYEWNVYLCLSYLSLLVFSHLYKYCFSGHGLTLCVYYLSWLLLLFFMMPKGGRYYQLLGSLGSL